MALLAIGIRSSIQSAPRGVPMVVDRKVGICWRHRRHWWRCPVGEFVADISGSVQYASMTAVTFDPGATGEADASDRATEKNVQRSVAAPPKTALRLPILPNEALLLLITNY